MAFASGSSVHTQVMKTEALKQALDKYGFDAAFGGARRDEEKSRAKERVFSFRSAGHVWDPRNQRPELWRLYNTRINKGETIRVFPLSNWTELDIWEYTRAEAIPVVPLYGTVLFKVMKQLGLDEGCIEQIDRLFRTRLAPDVEVDEARRIRLDDWELSPEVQAEVLRRWPLLSTETLGELADLPEYRRQFLRLFGFGVDGVDYAQDVDPRVVAD